MNFEPYVLLVPVWAIAYFFPSLLAAALNRRDLNVVFLANFFLGWTIFIWLLMILYVCIPRGLPPVSQRESHMRDAQTHDPILDAESGKYQESLAYRWPF